jgi:FkbM family methyltransferase
MASLSALCTMSSRKTRLLKTALSLLRLLGVQRIRVRVEFSGRGIPVVVPLEFAEPALLNIEHVFVDCDYFQVEYAVPKPGSSALDAGGFLGFYATAFTQLASRGGAVHVFEPNPLVLPYLAENAEMASTSGALVRVYPRALCAESGQVYLYIGENPAVTSTLREHVEEFTSVVARVPVKCTKLSTVLRYLERVDVVKLDVEGLELELLREASSELKRAGSLVVEVHRDLVDTSEVVELVSRVGFEGVVVYTSSEMPYQAVLYAKRAGD